MSVSAFFSYVHADNDHDAGRILKLASDLRGEYEAISGEQLDLKTDVNLLNWGHEWRNKLYEAVLDSTFFICVLTPRYFRSTECRNEFRRFAEQADELGRSELLLPIHYIEVPGLAEDSSDDLLARAAKAQWEPWMDDRFLEGTSMAYRRRVSVLAGKLMRRYETLPEPTAPDSSNTSEVAPVESPDDTPGPMDDLAEGEGSLDGMVALTTQYSGLMTELAAVTRSHSYELRNDKGNPKQIFARRLDNLRRFADAVSPISHEMERVAKAYVEEVGRADTMVTAMLTLGDRQPDPAPTRQLCEAIIEMQGSADGANQSMMEFQEATRELSRQSRIVREPLGRVNRAVQLFRDASSTTTAWAQEAEALLRRLSDED